MTEEPQNHADYLRALRAMTDEQRLKKALELSEEAKQKALAELSQQNPGMSRQEVIALYLKQLVEAKAKVAERYLKARSHQRF